MSKFQRKESRWVSILTVKVSGLMGLIEGMRYDRCCPATEADSAKIERMLSMSESPTDRIVQLLRYAAAPGPATADRWRSFNCRVLDERSPEEAPLTEVELINLANVPEDLIRRRS